MAPRDLPTKQTSSFRLIRAVKRFSTMLKLVQRWSLAGQVLQQAKIVKFGLKTNRQRP